MAKKKLYEIIWQDSDLLIANKSTGLPVIPGRNLEMLSLKQRLEKDLDIHLWTTHRIDKETSGLVVFAKNPEAHKAMNQLFLDHKIAKIYRCICRGTISTKEKTIDKPIFIDSKVQKVKIHPHGKASVSHFKSIETSKSFSLVQVRIETGRTHQVRVHLSTEGYPIIGDLLYNRTPEVFLKDIKKKFKSKSVQERPMISRCALHAWGLSFIHPITNELLELESELPKDIRACWNQMVKNDK